MKQSNSAVKKIDIFWIIFSIVALAVAVFLWQTGKDYFLSLMFVALGIIQSIKELISKILFNILRVLFSLGLLYYILRLIIE